jgi:plastocyanin
MLLSKAEITGFVIAIIGVAIMGVLVFTGPFHNINHTEARNIPILNVSIVTNPVTIGRFRPTTVTIHVGENVHFTNNTSLDHTVTSPDDTFDSKNIASGASWTFTPTSVGTFSYACSYHPLMKGTIVVLG